MLWRAGVTCLVLVLTYSTVLLARGHTPLVVKFVYMFMKVLYSWPTCSHVFQLKCLPGIESFSYRGCLCISHYSMARNLITLGLQTIELPKQTNKQLPELSQIMQVTLVIKLNILYLQSRHCHQWTVSIFLNIEG